MRVSKYQASLVAKKMTEKKKEEMLKLNREFMQSVTDEYKKTVPNEVLQLFEKYPNYFDRVRGTYLNGHGFNREYVELTVRYPDSGSSIELTAKLAEKLMGMKHKADNAKKEYNDLVSELEIALFNLRTYAAIEKAIPEAVPYLPETTSSAVAVNFTTLRSKLK